MKTPLEKFDELGRKLLGRFHPKVVSSKVAEATESTSKVVTEVVNLPPKVVPSEVVLPQVENESTSQKAIQGVDIPPREKPPYVISFRKSVASLEKTSEKHRVPFKGKISTVEIHFPPGCESLVDVRLLHYCGGSKKCVVPSVEDKYIALDDDTFKIVDRNFPAQEGDTLVVEYLNYDGGYPHTISVDVSIEVEGG